MGIYACLGASVKRQLVKLGEKHEGSLIELAWLYAVFSACPPIDLIRRESMSYIERHYEHRSDHSLLAVAAPIYCQEWIVHLRCWPYLPWRRTYGHCAKCDLWKFRCENISFLNSNYLKKCKCDIFVFKFLHFEFRLSEFQNRRIL